MGNNGLILARKAKSDEFYTQLKTIEDEVIHYREHFKGKIVYLNCDDPRESNFFKYFYLNFNKLGMKKLIASFYINQDYNLFNKLNNERAGWLEYTGGQSNGGRIDVGYSDINYFEGDGDFRGEESVELLKQADIIVTNPPFSLFREYVAQLMEYEKKFLILGNMNAITYRDIFPLIRNNKMWSGMAFNKAVEFIIPEHYDIDKAEEIDGKHYIKVPAISWWTNLDYTGRHEDMILFRTYEGNEDKYPKYDNYDAINVDKLTDIPKDYNGIVGVPITFIGKWNPDQFEMLGLERYTVPSEVLQNGRFTIDGKALYARILIRNKDLN